MELGLHDRRALVTCSTDGIGLATARALAREGARVSLDGRTSARVHAVVDALGATLPGAVIDGIPSDPHTRMIERSARRFIACALSFLAVSGASAHDTWLHLPGQQPGRGLTVLQLGTGARYPKSEGVVPASRVVDSGCVDETGSRHGLVPRSEQPPMLELRSRTGDAKAAGCWLELMPVDLTLTPELVQTYFHDVRAPQAVREAWNRQNQAGQSWNEVYRKYVRIESTLAGRDVQDLSRVRSPRGYPLELVPVGAERVRAKVPASFQALSNGKPVPDLPIEFVSLRSALGVWTQTDAQGRVSVSLPFGGEWLLRSTAFDMPAADGIWHTRFATLSIQVQ